MTNTVEGKVQKALKCNLLTVCMLESERSQWYLDPTVAQLYKGMSGDGNISCGVPADTGSSGEEVMAGDVGGAGVW